MKELNTYSTILNKHELHKILKKYWGFDSFRPMQEEIIHSILEKKDTLALLPTGGGKSLCYQVPALASDGICIVVSPLVALMKDQVAQLKKRSIKAIAITGGMRPSEVDIALDNGVYGDLKFLYVSPERLQSEIVLERIQKMKVSHLAVDEAHCISQWGNDFRPAYLNIAKVRALLPNVPVMALTATATKEVAKDIQVKLLFKNGRQLQNSFNRSNLAYMVLEEHHKMDRLQKMLTRIKGSCIVYVKSRKRASEMAAELNYLGIKSLNYHAGLSAEERNTNQNKWMNNSVRVMVATNAFGMGIDKPDVRLVVHLQSPNTLEAYFQEAGRAGRDGRKSFAVSLYQKSDLKAAQNRFEENYPSSKEVRLIYQKVANYLQLAIGDGFEQSFDFSLEDFCEHAKLPKEKCIKAFQILEKENQLKYDSYQSRLATVQIICAPSVVLNYQTNNSKKSELLQLILRIYPNLFDEAANINERKLAMQINKDSQYVYKILSQLNQEGILEYHPRNNKSKLHFLSARHDSKHLPLSRAHFEERKNLLASKLASMNDYLTNTDVCRSIVLLDYFDEKDSKDCGICDVCITKQSNSTDFRIAFKEGLVKRLKDKSILLTTLLKEHSKLEEEVIIEELKKLLQENIICKEDGKIKLND